MLGGALRSLVGLHWRLGDINEARRRIYLTDGSGFCTFIDKADSPKDGSDRR
jgi:hypothetical protein